MKPKTYEAVSLICDSVDLNNTLVPQSECESMAKQINEDHFPVLWNYDPSRMIGKTISARVEEGKLICTFQLRDDLEPEITSQIHQLFAGPGFSSVDLLAASNEEPEERANCKFQCLGVFLRHADKDATPIVEVKEIG